MFHKKRGNLLMDFPNISIQYCTSSPEKGVGMGCIPPFCLFIYLVNLYYLKWEMISIR